MLARTKKHPTKSIRITGSPEVISRVQKYALEIGAGILEITEGIPAVAVSPQLNLNSGGVYLRGIRVREDLTQEALAKITGITRSNISAMEHGRRPIGRETAKKLAAVLNCDYRRFL